MKKLLLVAVLAIAAWQLYPEPALEHPPGMTVPESPRQRRLDDARPFAYKDYVVTPLAEFHLKGRVLGTERYRFDREADIAPWDVALGWGPMSDSSVLEQLDISQGNRWYRWRTRRLPVPRRQIELNSANMHMIPADGYVADRLADLREGSLVEIRGSLVAVEGPDGWRWVSSLTREDTGARACELVWVEEITAGT